MTGPRIHPDYVEKFTLHLLLDNGVELAVFAPSLVNIRDCWGTHTRKLWWVMPGHTMVRPHLIKHTDAMAEFAELHPRIIKVPIMYVSVYERRDDDNQEVNREY